MAASSSSSSCIYEVFLNFRGEDTRRIFTCHLYDDLYDKKKIKTFMDDEKLRRGDEISDALLNAIQGSKISVVIFSTDYGSSKWCLNELVKILECKHTNGQIIIPVFYGVSPSDVRHQTGIFKHGFDQLKQHFEEKPEMVQRWRDALTETSQIAGHESTKFSNDAQLVNKIVEDVLKKLEKITVSTDSSNGLVGLNSRIEQIKPFLCMDLSDTVQIVGIWGTGGIGKTTLAEAIFDQFSGEFDGKYFAKNVRRKSETEGGLEDLQKEMLSTILSEKLEVAGPNIPLFTKGRVRRMKVLIVLDDVNKDEQLEGLIGGLDQYGPGSRIVVTTRDKRVLEKFGVEKEKIYGVNGLKFDEAFEHFCNFAFKENHCPEDLYRHSRRFVWYAKGNPLVLKVLGSSLYLKGKSHWENVLDDLNRICESDIHGIYDTLKISFKELTPRVKSMFLDIACFLEGEDKDFVLRILDDSGSHRLDVLVDKSLITVSDNCVQMHDLLQEMGQETVRQESEEEPGRRSRLWDPKEIRRVLKHNMGTDAIEGIFMDLSKIKGINLDPGAFTKMSNLRLLKFYVPEIERFLSMSFEEQLSYSKVQLRKGLDYLPKKLRYLHWDTYPLTTLPSNFKPKNLVELNLRFSKVEQLWEGKKETDAIEGIFLDLSKIKDINLDPGAFTKMSNLKLLKFYVPKFDEIERFRSMSIGVQLSYYKEIEKFLSMSIEEQLSYSKVQLPNGLDYLPKKLRYLHWDAYPLRTLPSNFKPKNLVELNLRFSKVEQLWEGEKEAFKLKSINLSHSRHFIKMPGPLETPNVETYLLDYTNLACVPSSIQNFKYLSRLDFMGCKSLRSFPSNLHFVCPVTINFSCCVNLKEFPQISGKVTSLNLGYTAIEEVPSSIECLTDLEKLDLRHCKRLKRISTRFCKLRSLVRLFLFGCLNLERFPEILEKMEHLYRIGLVWTALPSPFENLPGLVDLSVSGCSILDMLPNNIGNLSGNNFESLPASIKQLSWLSYLNLADCNMLQSLPELPLCLKYLELRDCKILQSLPELPLGLETLRLWRCNMLQSLPALPLGLETLHLEDCNMLRSLPELPLCLQSLKAMNCNRLQSLPEIPSCLQELDASALEKLSKPSPDLRQWHPEYVKPQPIYFGFTNCLKLDGKANNKILADSLRMAIAASLRLGYENAYHEKLSELRGSQIVLPGSEIPDWFSNQSSGSSIRIQLPPHSFCRNLIGFAFCAVLDFKQLYSDLFRYFHVGCRLDLEIKTLSETKHVDLSFYWHSIEDPHDSDHVILGFKPCLNVGFPDGYHDTTVSLKFFNKCYQNRTFQKGQKIKRCGVCPVYANPSEIKANTFTLNFATEVWKLDDLPSTSGTSDVEELEPST